MLLQALYEFYQLRKDESTAFTKKNVRWLIPLTIEGDLEGAGLIEIEKERLFRTPSSNRPKNAGGVAEFLWENVEGVFCLNPDLNIEEKDLKTREIKEQNRKRKFDDFWSQIQTAHDKTQYEELLALIRFKEKYVKNSPLSFLSSLSFLRWGKKDTNSKEKDTWWVKTTSSEEKKFDKAYFAFQVEGKTLLEDFRLQEYWEQVFSEQKETKSGNVEKGTCLVTGLRNVPISDSHLPKIKKGVALLEPKI